MFGFLLVRLTKAVSSVPRSISYSLKLDILFYYLTPPGHLDLLRPRYRLHSSP